MRAQEAARREVKAAHIRRETCRPERLQRDFADHGVESGIHRINLIRKKLGLRCKQKRKFKVTTASRHDLPVAPNLLDLTFYLSAPSQACVGDLTYVATSESGLCLVGLKGLY